MVSISVDTSEFDDLVRRYGDGATVMVRHMQAAMVRATAQVQHDAMVAVPVDTGHLRRSITTDVTPFLGRVGTNLLYGRVVEEGRRPNAPMPPPGALLGWMRRHGVPAEREYAIRLRIAWRGIAARPYLKPALEKNREAINREFARARDAALAEIAR